MLRSNVSWDMNFPRVFIVFPDLSGKCQYRTLNRQSFPYISVPVITILLLFNGIKSEELTALLIRHIS
jgi:multidrug efflux pump subunit AcrB